MDLVWKAKAAAYAELREKEREKSEREIEIGMEREQGRKMSYLTRARTLKTRKLERCWKREGERERDREERVEKARKVKDYVRCSRARTRIEGELPLLRIQLADL